MSGSSWLRIRLKISLLFILIIMIIPPFPISFEFITNLKILNLLNLLLFFVCVCYCIIICNYQSLLNQLSSQTTQHDFVLLINVSCTNLLEFSPFMMKTTASAWKEDNMCSEIHLLMQPPLGRKIVIVYKDS